MALIKYITAQGYIYCSWKEVNLEFFIIIYVSAFQGTSYFELLKDTNHWSNRRVKWCVVITCYNALCLSAMLCYFFLGTDSGEVQSRVIELFLLVQSVLSHCSLCTLLRANRFNVYFVHTTHLKLSGTNSKLLNNNGSCFEGKRVGCVSFAPVTHSNTTNSE